MSTLSAMRLACVVLGLLATGARVAADEPVFTHRIVDPEPPSGSGCCLDILAVGDLDGDGRPDILIGSEHAEGALWYHAPDWRRYPIAAGDFTTDGRIADLDGDGDNDIVISSISRDAIEWYENTGDPFTAAGWVRHVIGAGYAHDLAVGDLDGDGRPDVVALRKDPPRQLIWWSAPAHRGEPAAGYRVAEPEGEGLALADLDGDGFPDLVAGDRWYRNRDGHGRQWTARMFAPGRGAVNRIAIGDLDGDGRPDIVISPAEESGPLLWYRNPDWREHPIDGLTIHGGHSLGLADFDGDGTLDVFVGEMNEGRLIDGLWVHRLMVVLNRGASGNGPPGGDAGSRWRIRVLATGGTHNAVVADLDGDARPDIVGKNYRGPKAVELWLNDGRGTR